MGYAMHKHRFISLIVIAICSCLSTASFAENSLESLATGEHRSAANIARNPYRNPTETLTFFGLKPTMTVVEIWPGGGWYSEIIAPYLSKQGTFYGAHFSEQQSKPFFKNMRQKYIASFAQNPELYGNPKVTGLYPPFDDLSLAPKASADLVLTFRNVHNWTKGGFDKTMFSVFYDTLKPGAILGVVEHRAKPGTSLEAMIKSGYMTEEYVIKLAESVGFKLVASSDINSNPKDSADHPNGVWSLPPTLRGGDNQRDRFLAIGESDRMTLKFQKPGN